MDTMKQTAIEFWGDRYKRRVPIDVGLASINVRANTKDAKVWINKALLTIVPQCYCWTYSDLFINDEDTVYCTNGYLTGYVISAKEDT